MQKTLLIVAAGSALLGGLSGAGATLLLTGGRTPSDASKAAAPEIPSTAQDPELARRLSAVEGSLRALERREFVARASAALDGTQRDGEEAARGNEKPIVDDPVFEAAVLDVLDRAEETRASERAVRREEQRKERLQRWGNEIGTQLGLTPAQRERVVELRRELNESMRRDSERDGGARPTRRERRERAEALRTEAEKKLAGVLDGRQMQAYEKLDPELRLGGSR